MANNPRPREVETGSTGRGNARFSFGPGLVFFLAATGPGAFVSNSAAGATYGYSMMWSLALALSFRFVWVNTSAKYVLVTRESLMQGYARMGSWLIWISLAATILVRHSSNLYTILMMGNAAHILCPLPIPGSGIIWALALTSLGFSMMFWGGYPVIERACRILIAVMGGALVIAAVISKPDPAAIARGILIPWVPNIRSGYSSVLLLAAMIGAQAGTLSNLSYSYFSIEKGWKGPSDLKRQRTDLLISTGCKFVMGALLQIAAATTLFPSGIQPQSAEHLVRIFSEKQGELGRIIFALGLCAICFSNYVSGTTGYAFIVRDICLRFVPGLRRPQETGDAAPRSERDRIYRWSVALLALSPVYIVFTGAEPVALTLMVRSLVVIIIPVLVGTLLKLTTDRTLMGPHRNGWLTNAFMVLLIIISIYLSARNMWEWWLKLSG